MTRSIRITALAGLLCLLSPLSAVQAAVFNVIPEVAVDRADQTPNDGDCREKPDHTFCTLRAAIQAANRNADATNTIYIHGGTYVLTLEGRDENRAATGDLDVYNGNPDVANKLILIEGVGDSPAVIGSANPEGNAFGTDRVFHVLTTGNLILRNIVLTKGSPVPVNPNPAVNINIEDHWGGAILNRGTVGLDRCIIRENRAYSGGAIYNLGRLAVNATRFVRNLAVQDGGAVSNNNPVADSMTIISSLFDGNSVLGSGNGQGRGGALISTSKFKIFNSTLTRNLAQAGGAIYRRASADIDLSFVTITKNIARVGGGIYSLADNGAVYVQNSIIAQNSVMGERAVGPDCYERVVFFGYNILGTNQDCQVTRDGPGSDLIGTPESLVDPRLEESLSLKDGQVESYAPLEGSPALERGPVVTIDGVTYCKSGMRAGMLSVRTPINKCDSGAYEPSCGNNRLERQEACDDGNEADGDGCDASCRVEVAPQDPVCGDGQEEGEEACDDANLIDGDGCSSQCLIEEPVAPPVASCGNAAVEGNETCDDGNVLAGDGCTADCQTEVVIDPQVPVAPPAGESPRCGDGTVNQDTEVCDDGNADETDECLNDCTENPEIDLTPPGGGGSSGGGCDLNGSSTQTHPLKASLALVFVSFIIGLSLNLKKRMGA